MVYILLGTGFEEVEALTPCDLLRRAGIETALVGVNGIEVAGSHRITVRADLPLDAVDLETLDMVVLPGGLRGVQSLLGCPAALDLVRRAWNAGKFVCAICAAPTILAELGIAEGRETTCYPGMEDRMTGAKPVDAPVVRSGRLITGRAAGASIPFALELIKALKGREAADQVARQIVY